MGQFPLALWRDPSIVTYSLMYNYVENKWKIGEQSAWVTMIFEYLSTQALRYSS